MIIKRLKNIFLFFSFVSLILGWNVLHAQVRQLTLDEALNIAVANNHDVNASRLNVRKSEAMVDEALGNAMPSVNISASYTRNLKVPVFFVPGALFGQPNVPFVAASFSASNQYQAVASFSQILFNSAVFTGIGTSKIYENASYETLKSAISKTILNTKKAFYGVLLAKEYWNTMKVSFEKMTDNLKTVSALYTEGMIPEYDFIRARVGVENLKPVVIQAESGYINAMNALKMNLSVDIKENFDVTGELTTSADEPNIDENELYAKSNQGNFDLRTLELQKAVLKEMVTIRKSEFYPTVALFGNYVFTGQSNDFNFLNAQSSGVGINFSMNIFQGMQSKSRVEQASVDLMTLEERYKQVKEGLQMQIKVSVLQLRTAIERMKAQDDNVKQAERGYEIAGIRYKEGVGSQVEINDADVQLVQAKVNRLQSIYDYMSSKAEMDNLTGQIDPKYIKGIISK